MEKSTINLHMHSNYSLDGSESPISLLDQCEQKGITTVSITDHDSCAAYYDLKNTRYTGNLITGIEADAMVGKETYDILCVMVDNLKNNIYFSHLFESLQVSQFLKILIDGIQPK